MNKELILTSLMALNPVAEATATQIRDTQIRTAQLQEDLTMMILRSGPQSGKLYYIVGRDHDRNEVFSYYVQFQFSKVGEQYATIDGEDADMEYMANVTLVDSKTGEILQYVGESVLANRIDENSFQIYECGSTVTCDSKYNTTKLHILFDKKLNKKFAKFNNTSQLFWDFPKIERFEIVQ